LVKLSSAGKYEAGYCYAQPGTYEYYYGGLVQLNNGSFLLSVRTEDYNLINIDEDGNVLFNKRFGGFGSDQPMEMELSSAGEALIIGSTTSNTGQVSGNHGESDFC
jgi:hypothetical protein